MNLKHSKNNRKGVVLITVVMVMSVAFILVTAIIGLVSKNVDQTMSNYRKEQAFLSASTYLESFVNDIEKQTTLAPSATDAQKTARNNYIKSLKTLAKANSGNGTVSEHATIEGQNPKDLNMGDITVTIKQEGASGDNIVILATCKYFDEEDTVAAHISIPSNSFPDTYNNAIEIAGNEDVETDNINVIGNYTRISSSKKNTGLPTYTLKNSNPIFGGMFYYGNVNVNTSMRIVLQKSYTKNKDGNYTGSGCTVTGDMTWENEGVIVSAMDYVEGKNYLYVGGTLKLKNKTWIGGDKSGSGGTEPHTDWSTVTSHPETKVDVFCRSLNITQGNENKFNGDVCVLKNGAANGNASINSSNQSAVVVYGDLFVEGDFNMSGNGMTVYGNVYVGGNISAESASKIYKPNGTKATIIKSSDAAFAQKKNEITGRLPEIPLSLDTYKYRPEYLLAGGDDEASSSSMREHYKQQIENPTTLRQVVASSSATSISGYKEDGTSFTANFHAKITKSFTLTSDVLADNMNKNKKYLINVTDATGDIVVVLDDVKLTADAATLFVVKNDTRTSKGCKYACYFVTKSGLGTANTTVKNSFNIDVQTRTGMHAVNFEASTFGILDYDTYVNIWNTSDLSQASFSQNPPELNQNVILNTTDKKNSDLVGAPAGKYYYKPHPGSIHFLATKGSKITFTNASMFECEFYCPEANLTFRTGNANNVYVSDSAGNVDMRLGSNGRVSIMNIGMVVANNLKDENVHYYVFNQPDPASFWGPLKGSSGYSVDGYKLSRYDYH